MLLHICGSVRWLEVLGLSRLHISQTFFAKFLDTVQGNYPASESNLEQPLRGLTCEGELVLVRLAGTCDWA